MFLGKIDVQPREKALQASAEEKVAFGQLDISHRLIAEPAAGAIDLATFKAKEDITTALSFLQAKAPVDRPKLLLGPCPGSLSR